MRTLLAHLSNSLRRRPAQAAQAVPTLPAPMTSIPPVGAYVRLRDMVHIPGTGLLTPNVLGKVVATQLVDDDEVIVEYSMLGGFSVILRLDQLAAGYSLDTPAPAIA